MTASADQVRHHLQAHLQATQLEVTDESAAHAGHAGNPDGSARGTHLRVRVASPVFDGLSAVAAHRLVYDGCGDFFAQGLHALAIEIVR